MLGRQAGLCFHQQGRSRPQQFWGLGHPDRQTKLYTPPSGRVIAPYAYHMTHPRLSAISKLVLDSCRHLLCVQLYYLRLHNLMHALQGGRASLPARRGSCNSTGRSQLGCSSGVPTFAGLLAGKLWSLQPLSTAGALSVCRGLLVITGHDLWPALDAQG